MKIRSKALLTSILCLTSVSVYAEKAETRQHTSDITSNNKVDISQANQIQEIASEIIKNIASVSGPEEFFKMVNGQTNQGQITNREHPLMEAISTVHANGYHLTCYQENNDKVIASTDPTLLGKDTRDQQTENGQSIHDFAVGQLKNSTDNKSSFTYRKKLTGKEPVVNGKPVTQNTIAYAMGRKALGFPNSEKKFICVISADVR